MNTILATGIVISQFISHGNQRDYLRLEECMPPYCQLIPCYPKHASYDFCVKSDHFAMSPIKSASEPTKSLFRKTLELRSKSLDVIDTVLPEIFPGYSSLCYHRPVSQLRFDPLHSPYLSGYLLRYYTKHD